MIARLAAIHRNSTSSLYIDTYLCMLVHGNQSLRLAYSLVIFGLFCNNHSFVYIQNSVTTTGLIEESPVGETVKPQFGITRGYINRTDKQNKKAQARMEAKQQRCK